MANYTANLTLDTSKGDKITSSKLGNYTETITVRQDIDGQDAYTILVDSEYDTAGALGVGKTRTSLNDAKMLIIRNTGNAAAEIMFLLDKWTAGTPDTYASDEQTSHIITPGDFMVMPNLRMLGYSVSNSAAGYGTVADNQLRGDSSMVVYSNATLGEKVEDTLTDFDVSDSDYFRVGDIIQIGIDDTTATRIECMRVTAISGANLTVERGLFGTSIADGDSQTNATNGAVSGARVYYPIFNQYFDYDTFSKTQTGKNGKFKCTNFFGYGRRADNVADGITPGSVAIKFYTQPTQSLGLSDISSNTHTGLSASTTYYFTVALDGGSADEISFATDATNLNFGGANGVLEKIQGQLDANFYNASKNMYSKKVTVSIENGDVVFRYHARLKASTIAITAGTSGTAGTDEFFDGTNTIGRFPANIRGAVATRLPDDLLYDDKSYATMPNVDNFMYDNGNGQLIMNQQTVGTVNYETGAVDFTGPANAQFVVTVNYGSAHSGGNEINESNNRANCIKQIQARSLNTKITTSIEVIGIK